MFISFLHLKLTLDIILPIPDTFSHVFGYGKAKEATALQAL